MAEKRRIFLTFFFALLLLTALLFGVTWLPLRQARKEWREGRTVDAIARANSWSRLMLWPRQYRQLLAAAYLSAGNSEAAQEHLRALDGEQLWISVIDKGEVANRLFARGRYADFLAYDDAVEELREGKEVPLYRAAAQLATEKVSEAEATLKTIDRDDADAQKLAALERALADRKQGSYPYVVDRNGQPIALYAMANDDVVALNTDFAALVEKEAGALTFESNAAKIGAASRIETTLDAAVQKAAVNALGGFRSSLVAIDPKTGEILAIASGRGPGELANLALEKQYEPGSVMKAMTAIAAREHNVQLAYPYTCTGSLDVDGRNFGDWLSHGHGVLPDLDEAMAQSCNVVFADYGIRVGRDRLQALLARAGFGSQADLGLFHAPLGKIVGNVFNNFETGFLAIGVEHETATTLHLAMLASMIANRGTMTPPRLYTARRSILGETLDAPPKAAAVRVAAKEHVEPVIEAMEAVVRSERGTGRRARIVGLQFALKTGTAGKEEHGYHAVVFGFAPVDNPKIAFALVAEEAGPAEFAAAKIAHDFLTAIRPRL